MLFLTFCLHTLSDFALSTKFFEGILHRFLWKVILIISWNTSQVSCQWDLFSCLLNDVIQRISPDVTELVVCSVHSFHHSGYFCSTSSSPILLRCAHDTARVLCLSFTPKCHRQLRVKGLPKVPTWWLELDSNLWPSDERRWIYQCATTSQQQSKAARHSSFRPFSHNLLIFS